MGTKNAGWGSMACFIYEVRLDDYNGLEGDLWIMPSFIFSGTGGWAEASITFMVFGQSKIFLSIVENCTEKETFISTNVKR